MVLKVKKDWKRGFTVLEEKLDHCNNWNRYIRNFPFSKLMSVLEPKQTNGIILLILGQFRVSNASRTGPLHVICGPCYALAHNLPPNFLISQLTNYIPPHRKKKKWTGGIVSIHLELEISWKRWSNRRSKRRRRWCDDHPSPWLWTEK